MTTGPPQENPFHALSQSLHEMEARGRRRRLIIQRTEGPYLISDQGEQLVNFGGNDYLGVVSDALLSEPSLEVSFGDANRNGIPKGRYIAGGATASALVCGWTPHHQRLAEAIARIERTEAAVVFPSGYAACSGTVATLCRENDLILSDELNHASLIDGCRMSRAERKIYRHRDLEQVARLLGEHRGRFENVWIVTDGVFSMDGTCAPLAELARLARANRATLLVDEAHGTGILGNCGGGLCEAVGMQDEIPIRIGTLSKAIGHQGGFVAGPRVVIDYLIQFCRPLIYSTALSPQTAAGAHKVIDAMPGWNDRRVHVAGLARELRNAIGLGDATHPMTRLESGIPIVPIIIGGDQRAIDASSRLRAAGFYVPAIRPPTVPDGTARLRVSLTAAHRLEHVQAFAAAYSATC